MTDPLKAGQLPLLRRSLRLDIDMDHVARLFPLVAPHRRFGVKVLESSQTQALHEPANGGKGRGEGPCDAAERAALVPEVYGLLQLMRIERPPLSAANTPSIRKCSHTACSVPGQPLVSTAQTDPGLRCKGLERYALMEVPTNQTFPTDGCQSGQWVAMHGV